jgi:hypothetical protein
MQDVELHERLLTAFAFHSRPIGSAVCVAFLSDGANDDGISSYSEAPTARSISQYNSNMVADRSKP